MTDKNDTPHPAERPPASGEVPRLLSLVRGALKLLGKVGLEIFAAAVFTVIWAYLSRPEEQDSVSRKTINAIGYGAEHWLQLGVVFIAILSVLIYLVRVPLSKAFDALLARTGLGTHAKGVLYWSLMVIACAALPVLLIVLCGVTGPDPKAVSPRLYRLLIAEAVTDVRRKSVQLNRGDGVWLVAVEADACRVKFERSAEPGLSKVKVGSKLTVPCKCLAPGPLRAIDPALAAEDPAIALAGKVVDAPLRRAKPLPGYPASRRAAGWFMADGRRWLEVAADCSLGYVDAPFAKPPPGRQQHRPPASPPPIIEGGARALPGGVWFKIGDWKVRMTGVSVHPLRVGEATDFLAKRGALHCIRQPTKDYQCTAAADGSHVNETLQDNFGKPAVPETSAPPEPVWEKI